MINAENLFNETFRFSFRCYYPSGEPCNKFQTMRLCDVPRWIDSYKFTHPDCIAVTVKIWFSDLENE